jgi:hypothetical protein
MLSPMIIFLPQIIENQLERAFEKMFLFMEPFAFAPNPFGMGEKIPPTKADKRFEFSFQRRTVQIKKLTNRDAHQPGIALPYLLKIYDSEVVPWVTD